MTTTAYTLISVFIVSSLSLVGIFSLALNRKFFDKILFLLVSFAVGGLFGDAFIHLLPEAYDKMPSRLTASLYVIAGILLFYVVERFLRWRHCHSTGEHEHVHPVVVMNLIGDAVHNMIDGMVIAASFIIDVKIGVATTVAVFLHEIPHEIGNFAIYVHGGLSIRKAVLLNVLSAVFAFLGAVLMLAIGVHFKSFSLAMLPITAGGFIYIAGSDLVPELQQKCDVKLTPSILQFISILSGIGIMSLLLLLD